MTLDIYKAIKDIPLPSGVTTDTDENGKIIGYFYKGYRICAAKRYDSNGNLTICLKRALENSGRCYLHHGKAAKGLESKLFKSGLYSKYMPEGILVRYHKALNDPDVVSLRQNLALTEVRITQLLERLETSDTLEYWQKLQSWITYFDAQDEDTQLELIPQLRPIITSAIDDYKTWQQIQQVSDEKRKLAESERKRMLDMQQYITAERAMILISAITEIIRRNVTDQTSLAAISDGIKLLLTDESGRVPGS